MQLIIRTAGIDTVYLYSFAGVKSGMKFIKRSNIRKIFYKKYFSRVVEQH